MAKSLFSSLKAERCNRRKYTTRVEANADVFDYIECFYSVRCRHATLGYVSPAKFERQKRV